MTTIQQQRLSVDTLSFQDVSVNTRSTTVVQSSIYDALISGVSNLAGATVLGLGSYSMDVTAANVGLGEGNCVASANTGGSVVFRRIKAGTDLTVSSSSTTISVNLAPSISRTNLTVNGSLSVGPSSFSSVTSGAATINGDVTVSGTFSPNIPTSAIWSPQNKGDLLTFTTNSNALTHLASGQTDGKVLSVDNNSETGLSWISPPNLAPNIENTVSVPEANRILCIDVNNQFTGTPVSSGGNYLTDYRQVNFPKFLYYDYTASDGSKVSWDKVTNDSRQPFRVRPLTDLNVNGATISVVSLSVFKNSGDWLSGTGTSRFILRQDPNDNTFSGWTTTNSIGADPYMWFNFSPNVSSGPKMSIGTYQGVQSHIINTNITVSGNSTAVAMRFVKIARYTTKVHSTKADTWTMSWETFRGLAGNSFSSVKTITTVTPVAAVITAPFTDSIPVGQMRYAPIMIGYSPTTGTIASVTEWRMGSVGVGRDVNGNFVCAFRYDGTQYAFGSGYMVVPAGSVNIGSDQ